MYILNSNLDEISLNVGLHNSTFGPPMVATELMPHKCQVQYLRLSAPAPLDSVVILPYVLPSPKIWHFKSTNKTNTI